MIKRNATYRVTVFKPNSDEKPVVIEYPLTCKFNCQRATFSQSNKCTIELYNVDPTKREYIFKDIFADLDPQNWEFVKLEAGWDGALSQIFYGRIMTAYSSKTGGQVDVITRIESIPFDIFNMQTGQTFEAGTSYRDAYKSMAGDLPNCQFGHLGNLNGEFKTQTTFSGNTLECLNELTGGHTFVDNGMLNTIMSNEVIDVPIPLITDDNGLLATPARRQASITIKTLFEPTIIVGQLVEIKSHIQPEFDGQWKVVGFTHDCLISPTQAGQRTTTMELLNIPMALHSDINLTGEKVIEGEYKVKNESVVPLTSKEPNNIRDVYNYIKKNKGKIPNTQITKNIWWKEMLGHNNADAERLSEISLPILKNCFYTAQTFQRVIDKYYSGSKILITSGWRSTRNNKSCGGNPKSKHLQGLAIDFKLPSQNTYNVYQKFEKVWQGWVGFYKDKDFIHIQTANTKGFSNDV